MEVRVLFWAPVSRESRSSERLFCFCAVLTRTNAAPFSGALEDARCRLHAQVATCVVAAAPTMTCAQSPHGAGSTDTAAGRPQERSESRAGVEWEHMLGGIEVPASRVTGSPFAPRRKDAPDGAKKTFAEVKAFAIMRLPAQMAELVDALVSGTSAARRGGSSPLLGTSFTGKPLFGAAFLRLCHRRAKEGAPCGPDARIATCVAPMKNGAEFANAADGATFADGAGWPRAGTTRVAIERRAGIARGVHCPPAGAAAAECGRTGCG